MRRLGLLFAMMILGASCVAFRALRWPLAASGRCPSTRTRCERAHPRPARWTSGSPTRAHVVRLFSSDPSAAQVPASITIAAWADHRQRSPSPRTPRRCRRSCRSRARRRTTSRGPTILSVNAATPAGLSLSSVSFVPTSVVGGQNATGTVRFTAPMTQGAVVRLSSSQPVDRQVPQEIVVSANTSTSTLNRPTHSTVTGPNQRHDHRGGFGVTRTTTITVKPGSATGRDVVRITKATWKRGPAQIEASEHQPERHPQRVLRVRELHVRPDEQGRRTLCRPSGFVTNPVQISVRSNFGGAASAVLKS